MSILAARVTGALVWDLFSGSGAFGLECLSCGAGEAVFLDSSPVNLAMIRRFLKERPGEYRFSTVRGRLPGALKKLSSTPDIVFMDPPYDSSCIYSWIKETSWSSVVVPGGVVVAESGGEEFPEAWEHRKYGDTHIHILEV